MKKQIPVFKIIFPCLWVLSFFACGSVTTKPKANFSLKHTADSTTYFDGYTGVSEKDIYLFMLDFIRYKNIPLNSEVDLSPGWSSPYLRDTSLILIESYRKKQLGDSVKGARALEEDFNYWKKTGKWRWTAMTYTCYLTPTAILSREDYRFMCRQEQRTNSFRWDMNRLGIHTLVDTLKSRHWYRFSLPLFSKDRTSVLIACEDLCPGLCGNGELLLYKKEDEVWKVNSIGTWYH